MKSSFLMTFFFFPVLLCAQGIRFEKAKTWKQVQQKAKEENKYIFVDCAASWCLPCKKMEKEVFSLKSVGDFINERFVSVHLQLDTSKADDEYTKSWYSDAHTLQQQYKIAIFPTYLFFAPDGRIVHRYRNAIPDSLFLKVASNALDPGKQYYTILYQYHLGKKDYSKLNYLASVSRQIGEDSLAKKVAREYVQHYLNNLSIHEILQKKNLEFLRSFSDIIRSNDALFALLNTQPIVIDSILNSKGFSQAVIVGVITADGINPVLWPNRFPSIREPNWTTLKTNLNQKFGERYVGLALVYAQIKWYQQKKDRPNQMKYVVEKFEKYGLDTAGIGWALINNVVFDIFLQYCVDVDTLKKAIGWMEIIIKAHPEDAICIDTYANLLYKVGRKKEALSWEKKALDLEEKAAEKEHREADKSFLETLNKIKNDIPTWVVK